MASRGKKLNKIDSEIDYGCHGVEIMVGAGDMESQCRCRDGEIQLDRREANLCMKICLIW